MIRAATPTDYASYATLCRELAVDDPTPTPAHFEREIMRDVLVHERSGTVDGYVAFYALSHAGYVRDLVVAPDARNSGIGAALMRAAATALRTRGSAELRLNVRASNAPAIHLYEHLGMDVEHRSTVLRFPWTLVDALPREWAHADGVTPEEDAEIERALNLVAGRIAMGRMRDGRVQLQLRDANCAPVGFATFDPSFPRVSLFRVARPELAATLLAALRPYARHERVQIVIEDHAELVELLLARGAERRLELLHYRGSLAA